MQKVQKWEEKEIPKPLQMQMLNNLRTGQRGAKHTGVKGVLEVSCLTTERSEATS